MAELTVTQVISLLVIFLIGFFAEMGSRAAQGQRSSGTGWWTKVTQGQRLNGSAGTWVGGAGPLVVPRKRPRWW